MVGVAIAFCQSVPTGGATQWRHSAWFPHGEEGGWIDSRRSAVADGLGRGISRNEAQFELDPDLVGVSPGDPSTNRWFLVVAHGDPVTRLRVAVRIRRAGAVADPRLGPAGAGKTRMLAAAVDAWQTNGIAVFGVGPSATAAQQVETGAATEADTVHELVHEHTNGRQPVASTSDELNLTNTDTGHCIALSADYVAAGNPSVDYASTMNRAQGATVDEADLLLGDRTNSKQLYVGVTR